MLKPEKVRLQHTLRIYTQGDQETLEKAFEKSKKKFDNMADFIRHCVILGARKLLGDNAYDEIMNLTEIKESLTEINKELKRQNGERKADSEDQHIENKLFEKLLNYVACAAFNNEGNKFVGADINEGLVNIDYEKVKIMNAEYEEKNVRRAST